ncbi:MAG: hypothetical protein HYY13_02165 [Nitrospirae bacterium]|nr:hypothetical protein [Nitrospirota bacterium]
MNKKELVALIMRIYAVAFLLVGLLMLFGPDALGRVFNDLGDRLGLFADAPATGNLLWLSLAVSYMAVVTMLAYYVQKDPVKNKPALIALTLGKATSSLTSFAFYYGNAKAFIYLTNGLVDGSIVLVCLLCLFWLRGQGGGRA